MALIDHYKKVPCSDCGIKARLVAVNDAPSGYKAVQCPQCLKETCIDTNEFLVWSDWHIKNHSDGCVSCLSQDLQVGDEVQPPGMELNEPLAWKIVGFVKDKGIKVEAIIEHPTSKNQLTLSVVGPAINREVA